MRLGVISDVHSDYHRFRHVLSFLNGEKVDRILCCGDLVGYGQYPEEVVREFRRRNIISVLGNHECGLLDDEDYKMMNDRAKKAINHNLDLLSFESFHYILNLRETEVIKNMRIVHGIPPDSYSKYLNELFNDDIKDLFKKFSEKLAFCGHTHIPYMISFDGKKIIRIEKIKFNNPYKIEGKNRYIINVEVFQNPEIRIDMFPDLLFTMRNKALLLIMKYKWNMKIRLSENPGFNSNPYCYYIENNYQNTDWIDPIDVINGGWVNDHHRIVQELMVLEEEYPEMEEEILAEVFRLIQITHEPRTIDLILTWFPETQKDENLETLIYYCKDLRFIIDTFCDCYLLHTDTWCTYFLLEDIINRDLVKLITHIKNDWGRSEFIIKFKNNSPTPGNLYQLLKYNEDLRNDEWIRFFYASKPNPRLIDLFKLQISNNLNPE